MSEETEWDPFKLSSGLPLSGATVTVITHEFGYDAGYGADNCISMVTFQPDDGDAATQMYSVGKNFEPADRGATLVHKSGKPTNMNDNSNWGRFIKAFTEQENAADAMAETRKRKASPFDASWLIGMRFKLGDLPWINTMEKDPEKQKRNLIVPVEYLGTGEEVTSAKPAGKTGKQLAPRPGAATGPKIGKTLDEAVAADEAASGHSDGGDGGDEDFGIDDAKVLKQVIKLAKGADDWDAFTDAALEVDGVSDNKVWQRAIMNSKPGSIWAVHGS